jgi:hypothetical protein
LSLSKLDPELAARVSWYSLAVLDMNVSMYFDEPASQMLLQQLTKTDKCVWLPDCLDLWAIRSGELL